MAAMTLDIYDGFSLLPSKHIPPPVFAVSSLFSSQSPVTARLNQSRGYALQPPLQHGHCLLLLFVVSNKSSHSIV